MRTMLVGALFVAGLVLLLTTLIGFIVGLVVLVVVLVGSNTRR